MNSEMKKLSNGNNKLPINTITSGTISNIAHQVLQQQQQQSINVNNINNSNGIINFYTTKIENKQSNELVINLLNNKITDDNVNTGDGHGDDGNSINNNQKINLINDGNNQEFNCNELFAIQCNKVDNNSLIINNKNQILQKLPLIIPTSQLILKPGQTILKANKNVKLIQNGNINTNKIDNNTILAINSMYCNKNNSQIVNESSTTSVAISPQLIISPANNLNKNQQFLLQSNPTVLKENNQQFITTNTSLLSPQIQSNSNVIYTKSPVFTTVNSNSTGSLLKPIQIVKTNILPVGKNIHTNLPAKVNVNTPVVVKKQNVSPIVTTPVSIPSQLISHQHQPVSILKPLVKSSTAQLNSTVNNSFKNVNFQGTKILPKVSQDQQKNDADIEIMNYNSNDKVKTNEVRNKLKSSESNGVQILEKTNSVLEKPFGSNNPIEIIQQGHTFHSMQKLTPTQLKQIINVLQQRSQELSDPNERIVYRVVFPEELDLRMQDPMNNLLKTGNGKRGRPKKKAKTINKSLIVTEEVEDIKDDKKKIVARTRSGRLSRPPKHMVRDYKRLHHLNFTEPDIDDSDGGYSDYNTNVDKFENEKMTPDLLTGYEGPKRKISDSFRCPTCNKIYLGRSRMAKHFSLYPDHGSNDQLPPLSTEKEMKNFTSNPVFKRKGKKRGPWAYITPEAKSERRQIKLKEALSACESDEILKVAAKPVLNAQSLFDLMLIKSDNSVKSFLNELKLFMKKTRERINTMLIPIDNQDKNYDNIIELNDELLCNTLNLIPGYYSINHDLKKNQQFFNNNLVNNNSSSSSSSSCVLDEPPKKLQKVNNSNNKTDIIIDDDDDDEDDDDEDEDDDDCKENIDKDLSNFSFDNHSNDFDNVDFNNDKKLDNNCCPDVLTALTLIPRNLSPMTLQNNLTKFVLNNRQLDDHHFDYKKLEINNIDNNVFKKDEYNRLDEHFKTINHCSNIFPKMEMAYESNKLKNNLHQPQQQQNFIKLEPLPQHFIKLENSNVTTFSSEDLETFNKLSSNRFDDETDTFSKGFSKMIPIPSPDCINSKDQCQLNININNDLSLIQNNQIPITVSPLTETSTSDDNIIFDTTDNLDITKINYDLDLLKTNQEIDKHLIIDDKLVEQLNLDEQSKLVDEIVAERFDNILDNNLLTNNTNLHSEIDFEVLSQEFHRNTT